MPLIVRKEAFCRKLQQEEDVSAVDMEYSALCSAAFFRKIDFAALLLVSDEVWGYELESRFFQTGV